MTPTRGTKPQIIWIAMRQCHIFQCGHHGFQFHLEQFVSEGPTVLPQWVTLEMVCGLGYQRCLRSQDASYQTNEFPGVAGFVKYH